MPRPLRILLPNTPHHIVQRGHNRQPVFVTDKDYRYYLENLAFFKQEFDCRVYAYCLMTNHVHLIVAPGDDPDSVSQLMRRVAGRQTRYKGVEKYFPESVFSNFGLENQHFFRLAFLAKA